MIYSSPSTLVADIKIATLPLSARPHDGTSRYTVVHSNLRTGFSGATDDKCLLEIQPDGSLILLGSIMNFDMDGIFLFGIRYNKYL